MITIIIAGVLICIALILIVWYCIKEKRRERKEQEERNRQTQYGNRIYDEIAPGQAVDPHNIADEGGYGNKIIRTSWFESNSNLRNSRQSKLSFRDRLSTFFGRKPKHSENNIRKVSQILTHE